MEPLSQCFWEKGKQRTLHPGVTFEVQIMAPLLNCCDPQEALSLTLAHS